MARNKYSRKENQSHEMDVNPVKTPAAPFFSNGFCKGKETRHGLMLFNPKEFIGQTLDTYGEWGYSEIDLLNKVIKPGYIILDIGANIGTHTLSFAKSVQPNGFVYAFEPQRITFEFLCANIIINNFVNVFPMMAGVSDELGEIIVPILNPDSPSNAGGVNIEGHSSGDPIRLVTIDSLHLNGCNLIKIDVEGMERKVILGARQTINQFRPILFVENNTPENSESLIQTLFDLNYTCWWFFTEYLNRTDLQGNLFAPGEGFKPDYNMICLPSEWEIKTTGFVSVLGTDDTGDKAIARLVSQVKPS
jgi:FkbM family methyltransferase